MAKMTKGISTLERWKQKPGFKAAAARERQELLLSELVRAIMDEDSKSIRELAKELSLSKSVIQNLRSGAQADMKLSNFVKLTHAYGYQLVLEKDGQRITI